MAQTRRTRGVVLRALGVAAALVPLAVVPLVSAGSAAADTPWGATGSSYKSGVVCALPDGRKVALASWAVDGVTAFSLADVVARGASYGPAPRSGAVTDLKAGTGGRSAADLAALAYLIGHPGAGTPVQVAETSALVARTFGAGTAQQACLGRQGTSAAGAAALASSARRFAGPYTVQVAPVQAKPGSTAPVTATVLSAAGVPTPGITVSFAVDGASASAVTGSTGRATAGLVAPTTPSAVLTASIAEPTGLRLIASRPASVTLAAGTPVVARAAFVPVLHPTPHLSVTGGTALVLAGGSLTPTATVTGTYGYSGTGAVSVVGPVQAPNDGTCSGASFAGAPAVWSGTFAFAADGPRPVGSTGALKTGCYGFAGSLTTTDSTPAVAVSAAVDPAAAVAVSSLQLTQSTGSGLARTGALTATVTATAADGATVSSTLTTYGPLAAAAGGTCAEGQTWTAAKVLARSVVAGLTNQGGDRLAAAVHTPAVTATGCYALVARSTVTQNGRSAVVTVAPGAAGTTVLVIAPSVGVTNSAYDGRQGVPMTGTVHVTGTFGLPGRVAVGLVSAPAPAAGCHALTFPATGSVPAGSTSLATSGDGDYRFRSPVPSRNLCYGVVAMLAMTADTAVRADSTASGETAVFLAGAVVKAPVAIEVHTVAATRPTRELTVLGVAGAVVLVIALVLMVGAAVGSERKPDPRAGELLIDITERTEPATA